MSLDPIASASHASGRGGENQLKPAFQLSHPILSVEGEGMHHGFADQALDPLNDPKAPVFKQTQASGVGVSGPYAW